MTGIPVVDLRVCRYIGEPPSTRLPVDTRGDAVIVSQEFGRPRVTGATGASTRTPHGVFGCVDGAAGTDGTVSVLEWSDT